MSKNLNGYLLCQLIIGRLKNGGEVEKTTKLLGVGYDMGMKIVLATGIFPPDIGGPAQYAKELSSRWQELGHRVEVIVYRLERKLPPVLSHFVYFARLSLRVYRAEVILALDTFSVAWPAVMAGLIFGKKVIIRTGGDFLWEGYVERTGDLVLLTDFYESRLGRLNLKERIIFRITKFVLRRATRIVFSTDWQRQIWVKPYKLDLQKTSIIENFYGARRPAGAPKAKNFVGATRSLKWKNLGLVREVFLLAEVKKSGAILDEKKIGDHELFLTHLRESYAVILCSLGDISPNLILDAIMVGKPFILTSANGLTPRIKEVAILVDPQSKEAIKEAVLFLMKPENYERQKQKILNFKFEHSWGQMAEEYLTLFKNL